MKKNYTITLEEEAWRRLEEIAREQGLAYRGRLSRSAVIEQLVADGLTAVPAQPAAAVVSAPASAQPAYRLADIVASWPAKVQEQWQQEEWKAGRWVKLVLDTINGPQG